MMSGHLSFEQLSDLFDDEVTDSERIDYTRHLQECSICRKEYESLCMCLSILKGSKSLCGCIPDICQDTINAYRARERKRQYLKSVPAIAASVLIITSTGIMHTSQFIDEKSFFTAQVSTESDFQRIIDSVRDSKGNILRITEDYIDGEIPKSDMERLERVLHYFRIRHTIIKNSPDNTIRVSAPGMEDVSYSASTMAGSSMFIRGNGLIKNNADNDKIRVRIFK